MSDSSTEGDAEDVPFNPTEATQEQSDIENEQVEPAITEIDQTGTSADADSNGGADATTPTPETDGTAESDSVQENEEDDDEGLLGSLTSLISGEEDDDSGLLLDIISDKFGDQATHEYDIQSNIDIAKYKKPWDEDVVERALERMEEQGMKSVPRNGPDSYPREEVLEEIDDPAHLLKSVDQVLQKVYHELVEIIPKYDLGEERVKEDYADNHNLMTEIVFEEFEDGVLIEGGSQLLLNLRYHLNLSEIEHEFIKHAHAASGETVGLEDLNTVDLLVFISHPDNDPSQYQS